MDHAVPSDRVSYEVRIGDQPPDTWRVRRVEYHEALGEPYRLSLDVVATESGEDPLAWPGAEVELVVRGGEITRLVRGIVADVELRGATADGRTFASIRVVPALALLGMRVDSRIFQQRGGPDVVGDVLGPVLADWGRTYVGRFTQPHATREYCVQYRESDLDFARRLMEDEGLFCVFEQPDDEPERVIVLDDTSALPLLETSDGRGELALVPDTLDTLGYESVHAFEWRRGLRATGVVALDVDPLHPEAPIQHTRSTDEPESRAREHYVHGERRFVGDDAGARAELRLDGLRHDEAVGIGTSNALRLSAGSVFVLTGYPPMPDVRLLVVRVAHRGDCPEVDRFATGVAAPTYVNRFECVRADAPFRLPRRTARPRAFGPETAVVTGPEGEEIHVDEHGRVRVAMHWDRSGRRDDTSSCWLRCVQSWAGPGFGAMVVPRVGMEVVVDFLGGDPDRPLVTGCVYNATATPPHTLPDEKTKTTLRTCSSPGGDGFNELTFEDLAGSEQVFLHAQRDLVEKVRRNESMSIGADRGITIGRHDTLSVGGDQKHTIDGNQTIAVNGGGKDGLKGTSAAVKGAVEVTVTEPGTVLIDAAESITLKVGETSIVLDVNGISISAKLGASIVLDDKIVAGSKGASGMTLDGAVSLSSGGGTTFDMTGDARLASSAGSVLELSNAIVSTSQLGGKLELDANATMSGASVTAKSVPGSSLTLDDHATMIAVGTAKCESSGGSAITLDAQCANVQGPSIEFIGASLARMVAAMVKINE